MTTRSDYFVSTYAWIEKPLQETVAELVEGGWKAVEIMCEGRHGELLEWSEERLDWLKQIGQYNGISWTLHAPITGCNPASSDAEVIRDSSNVLHRTLQIAEKLGCAYVVVHPGEREEQSYTKSGNDQHESDQGGADERENENENENVKSGTVQAWSDRGGSVDEAANRVVLFLQEALKATEGYGVTIALENVPPYPGLLGADPAFLKHVVQRVGSPRVRIVFDVGHAHLTGKSRCLLALQYLLPYVISLHLSDNQGEHDDHLRLGAGTVPLEGVLALTRQFQYSGSWVLELRSLSDVVASVRWLEQRRTGIA
ncbi:sugar phosphate isomerase/epimerase family protein [Paenibacillus eucommiae]|uniref:Sugar phosphate isomerase/epimerase n=1 Tax=Paenibacillus eucommiae TaxID=1355755 RepID=A0ABS4ITX6_9BACL|nr:sugar phosphate isomerase/epimerase family protein [Paenibacillus eucommiae]MBP1991024.1 sugar phosphate isomerase/epimerase [Paenibacillus eucommiae]